MVPAGLTVGAPLGGSSQVSGTQGTVMGGVGALYGHGAKIDAPVRLTYAAASVPAKLEDWIYDFDLYCARIGIGENAARVDQALYHMDRDLGAWWRETLERIRAETHGAPVGWEKMLAALRAQFLSATDASEARSWRQIMDVRQSRGESMNAYFLRVDQLYRRAGGENWMNSEAVMKIVFHKVDSAPYPIAHTNAMREIAEGRVRTLAQLRATIVPMALLEPPNQYTVKPGASSSSSSSSSSAQSKQKPVYKGPVRAAAAGMDEEQEEGETTQVNATAARAGGGVNYSRMRCHRCEGMGHPAHLCSAPDKRKCFNCGEEGHLIAKCSKPRKTQAKAVQMENGEELLAGAPGGVQLQEGGIKLRICPGARKISPTQRLFILRGYARATHGAREGKLRSVEIRAMLDTGSEGDFMSPSLAIKLGARIATGRFGIAVGVFGEEKPIEKKVQDVDLEFRGIQQSSGLAHTFSANKDILIAPHELSSTYDMILGQPFMERYGAQLGYGSRARLELTSLSGATTTFPRGDVDGAPHEEEKKDGKEEECRRNEEEKRAVEQPMVWGLRACPMRRPKPLTGAKRREILQDWNRDAEERAELGKKAREECPQLVMTTEELEEIFRTSAPGTVRVTPIVCNGFVEDEEELGERIHVSRVARKEGKAEEKPVARVAKRGDLPDGEHERAQKLIEKLRAEHPDVFT